LDDDIDLLWSELKSRFRIGESYAVRILRHEPYGLFADVGYGSRFGYKLTGLIERFYGQLARDEENWPHVNDIIFCQVVGYRDVSKEIELRPVD